MTNADLIQDFMRFLRTKDLSDSTIQNYSDITKRMQNFVQDKYGADFGSGAVKGYMVSNYATSILEFKPTTRALYITALRVFLKFLYNMQYVDFDLSAALPETPNIERSYAVHPEQRPQKRNYTSEEIEKMFSSSAGHSFSKIRNRAAMEVLLATGLRVSELIQLKVGDVAETAPEFANVARKGTHGNKVKVFIPQEVRPVVWEYLKARKDKCGDFSEDDALFVNRNGTPSSRFDLYQSISRMQKAENLPTGIHTFRHTTVSAVSKQSDPVVARDLAGQKNLAVTNRYAHTSDDEKLAAAKEIAKYFNAVVNR